MKRFSKFVVSPNYRREQLSRPFKGFCAKRLSRVEMQVDPIQRIDPILKAVGSAKSLVDSTELKLRGGDAVTVALNGGLKAWDAAKTGAQSVNAMGEFSLGTHSLGESIAEWRKRHYVCCVCSGIACDCFYTAAIAGLFPGGYAVWKFGTKAGSVTKGGTAICRKLTGGF